MRSAFTLPEVLVAVLVLAVGILGLASSGTFIAIQAGESRALTEGAVLAGRVLDSLRATPCTAVAPGQVTWKQATIRWTAAPANRTVLVTATLELAARGGLRQWPVRALLPCER
jgi:prepilin-type N-terminal cleavage/methylation domain-containing protein